MNKPEQIPDTCKRCSYKRCIGLHWERSLVFSEFFAVPLDCPLKDCDTFELKHEPVVRGKYGKPCPIERRELTETATCPLDVREYTIENFRRLIGFPWDNDRIEVFDPSDCIDKIKHPLQPHLLPYEGANNDGKETDTPTVVPDEKWLYAFSKKGDKYLISEAFETVGSYGKAKYQHVSWKNAKSHKDKYPRKTEQEKKDSFL
ncbi:MAG: hypothetical protein GXY86_17890, partial [Firmicutes bacterium]|nr:hypothetical protein [Bacillota bacterium]